MQSIEESVDVM